MNAIVALNTDLPLAITNRTRHIDVNKEIVIAAQYPTLSIKGKVFTLVQDAERKVLRKPDAPDETVQALSVAFSRITMTNKVFYTKKFSEEDSEGQRPDCYSHDGIAPSPQSPNKQAAKCAVCAHNQWGSKITDDNTGKGKACADNARIAITDPTKLEKPMLLRVPPASLKPLRDALKMVKSRNLQYNEVVFRISFDPEAASPKLLFKPVGVLPDESYAKNCEQYESDIVRAIVGLDDQGPAAVAPTAAAPAPDGGDELDAALAARKNDTAAATPSPPPPPPPAPKPAKTPPPPPPPPAQAKVKEAEVKVIDDGDLLGDIESLLSVDD